MALEKRCKVCQTIMAETKKDGSSKLERRIFNCNKFRPKGETQSAIARDYDFNLNQFSNHIKFHQDPNAEKNRFEQKVEQEVAKRINTHTDVRQAIMDKGMEALENGEIRISGSVLRGAAKDAADIEEKNKDRFIKYMEMINAAIAGELPTGQSVPTLEPTRDYIEG